ncbi:MAG: hypothetical protein KJ792_02745 [Actinobacteria bacterium]|nr:hypothetical protein [Actinomycetota bacterium]MCG2800483.1 hypothetical protein [Cellulomonas sp.]
MRFFGFGQDRVGQALAPGRTARLASPWAAASTLEVISSDVFGAIGEAIPVTRAEAMRVPAVVSSRNQIVGQLAKGVLRAYEGDALAPVQPQWTYRTDSDVAPAMRLLWTFDDLFFGGFSLWQVYRDTRDVIGDAVRVPFESWEFDAAYGILVDDKPAQRGQVILFMGLDEGLLNTGASYVRGAHELHRAVRGRVKTPVPHTKMHPTDPDLDLSEDEIKALLSDWITARRNSDSGAVSWLPYGIEAEDSSGVEIALYEQGRNAEALDFSRLTGVPGALLEASGTSASLTYETRETARSILTDRLGDRATPVNARLSMDDVCAPGLRIALDLSALTQPDTGLPATTED